MSDSSARPAWAEHDIDLFAGIADAHLQAIDAIGERVELSAGASIFNLGETASALMLIESGCVGLTLPVSVRGESKDVTLDEKEAGAIIAWSALVEPHKFTLSARARSDVKLISLDRGKLQALLKGEPELHITFLKNLNRVIGTRVALLEGLVIRDLQRWVSEKVSP